MLNSIQVLRGLAASMVVLYHAILRFGPSPAIEPKIDFLNGGVDIFFVISGLVMVIATAKHDRNARTFFTARLFRIVPLYWISMLVTLAVIGAGLDERSIPPVNEIIKSFLFLFYTDSKTGQALPLLGVGWTLNYEMYFYLLFAATMWLPLSRQITVLVALFLAVATLRGLIHSDDPVFVRLTSPLPLEFSLGMILGWQRERLTALRPIVGLAMMIAGAILLLAPIPGPRTLVAGVPAGIIVAGAIVADAAFRGYISAPLLVLGNASYAFYLTHDIIMHLTIVTTIARAAPALAVLLIFLLCCAVAVLVHIFLEQPIIRLSNRIRKVYSIRPKPHSEPA